METSIAEVSESKEYSPCELIDDDMSWQLELSALSGMSREFNELELSVDDGTSCDLKLGSSDADSWSNEGKLLL